MWGIHFLFGDGDHLIRATRRSNATIHAIISLADGIDSTWLWHCWYVPLLELGRLKLSVNWTVVVANNYFHSLGPLFECCWPCNSPLDRWYLCYYSSDPEAGYDRWSRHRRRFILLTEYTTQQTPRRQILNGWCRSHWSASYITISSSHEFDTRSLTQQL
jgi:hypothetical protein